jgi:hypothetical protein
VVFVLLGGYAALHRPDEVRNEARCRDYESGVGARGQVALSVSDFGSDLEQPSGRHGHRRHPAHREHHVVGHRPLRSFDNAVHRTGAVQHSLTQVVPAAVERDGGLVTGAPGGDGSRQGGGAADRDVPRSQRRTRGVCNAT